MCLFYYFQGEKCGKYRANTTLEDVVNILHAISEKVEQNSKDIRKIYTSTK